LAVDEQPADKTHDPALGKRDYLREYLRITPVALALWRSIEAQHLATEELPNPILDLGCGFGEFAGVFFDDPLEAGIDIRRADLVRAQGGRRYKSLIAADARRLPFRSESFASVISISVLEHIPRMDEAVAEAYRVLKKGGAFVFTTPTSRFSEFLFYSRFLKKVGLSQLGRLYAALLNRALHHVSFLSEEDWIQLLERVGFRVERHGTSHSRSTVSAFDLMIPLGLHFQISRFLQGSRGVWRPEWLLNFWQRRLARYVEADEDEGCNLFVVARKP